MCLTTDRRVSQLIGLALCLSLATVPAAAQSNLPVPAPDEVKVYDRPSDDGSAIIVEWPKPDELPEGLVYIIEVAKSPEDLAAGNFQKKEVVPSEKALKSSNPKYFGFSKKNRNSYFLSFVPAATFIPVVPSELATFERLVELLELTDEDFDQLLREDLLDQARDARAPLESGEALPDLERERQGELAPALQRRQFMDGRVLSLKELQRARRAWPVKKEFDKGVKAAKKKAKAEKEKAKEAEEAARIARLKAAEAVHVASGEAKTVAVAEARKELRSAVATERKARAATAAATRRVSFVAEEIRKGMTSQQRSDLDWLTRLTARLKKREKEALEAADRKANAQAYYFRLAAVSGEQGDYVRDADGISHVWTAQAKPNYYMGFKTNAFVFPLVFSGIVLAFVRIARRNPNLFIRKIAGLDAVEEAIGRSTEMGRSVYFVHGLGGMDGLATIAAVNVLSRVAHRAAEYDTRVQVMNINPIVTAISQEVVQQAYTEAGRPDAYDADDVALTATSQFSYAAAVGGRMVREQPAAIFLIGSFMAESLLLAETGASTGAIQVAGTDSEHQLPFFITTCDYTLIGEELYAASAYLSRDPQMLGSLRGQDVGKAIMMVALIVGTIVTTILGTASVSWLLYIIKAR
ncbi:MAG: DUF6754 domain-containing protein [Planctomycetota bacterium]